MTISVGQPEPIQGVIFDFHTTLVGNREPSTWLEGALQHLGRTVGGAELDGLSEYLDRVWEHAFDLDPHSERDLSQAAHRAVFLRAVALRYDLDADLLDALYSVMPDQWQIFDDALPVLQQLRRNGIRIVLLSNTGLDLRAFLAHTGLAELVDGVVLSYELGIVKPQPEIFAHALKLLELPAGQALMVGDNWRDDGGAAALGIRTLILPRTTGPIHGLDAVLRLVGVPGSN